METASHSSLIYFLGSVFISVLVILAMQFFQALLVVHPHTSSVPEEAPEELSSREEATFETRSAEQEELPETNNSEHTLNHQHPSASS